MKIVHVVECFSGGVFHFLVHLIAGLSNYEHVIVYGTREDTPGNFASYFPPDVQYIPWEYAGREINLVKDYRSASALYKILGELESNCILHLHSSKAGFLGRLAAYRLRRIDKVVYTPHGLSFLRQDVSFWKRALFKRLEGMAAFWGGTVIACSQSERLALKKHGIQACLINNGIAVWNHPGKTKPQKDKLLIGTSGRITCQKNPALFNEFALQFQEDKKVGFVWIGDGELRNELSADNIEITGWLNQKEVYDTLCSLDIYLSTSLWEGLSLAVLQAMAAGMPLLLSNCIGNCDLVKQGENGFLFENLSAGCADLKKLLEDPLVREKMGIVSRKRVENEFSLEGMITNYEKIYQALIR